MAPNPDPEEKAAGGSGVSCDNKSGYDDNDDDDENGDHPKYRVELSKDLADVSSSILFPFESFMNLCRDLIEQLYQWSFNRSF